MANVVIVKTWQEELNDFRLIATLKFIGAVVIIILFSWLIYCTNIFTWQVSIYFGIFLFILLFILIKFRRKIFRHNLGSANSWEKIGRLPGWAYRKMGRKGIDKVSGEHYFYLRKGSNFYKKRK